MNWGRPITLGRLSLVIAAVIAIVALASTRAMAAGSPPAPSPPAAHVLLYLPGTFHLRGEVVTIPHRAIHAVGVVWPYTAGQWITVQVFLRGRPIEKRELRLEPAGRGNYGQFRATIFSRTPGEVVISASHAATSTLGAFKTRRSLEALDTRVGFGARGTFVQLIQQRLAALHFYIPQTGTFDQGTGWALDAYHRLLRWGTSQALDGPTINALLDGLGTFKVHFPHHGRHAEGNLSRQLLALIDGSHVEAIYPISSGKPSTPTILGDFHVYIKEPGYLPDGMYYSNFFYGNYAIHGFDPAPDYPASHGCMRLPIADATSVYGWLAIGDWVDVYN